MSRGLWQGGILAIDTSADVAATAGADGSVVLFDRAAGRVRAHLSAHAKRVTGARPKRDVGCVGLACARTCPQLPEGHWCGARTGIGRLSLGLMCACTCGRLGGVG